MLEGERILYAEDDPDIGSLVGVVLGATSGADFLLCENGMVALEQIEAFNPTVLLMDMMMPGLTGEQTVERIRAMPDYADTPVIFMTAKAQERELERFKTNWGAEVIVKPFDPVTLSQKIAEKVALLRQAT